MKIIDELANSTIRSNKKDTLATKLSIYAAVILLGTIIFIMGSLNTVKYNEIVSTIGDYHISISGISKEMYNSLIVNDDIEKITFDKLTRTDWDAVIHEKGDYYDGLKGVEVVEGRKPEVTGELMVPIRFLSKNKELELGSQFNVGDKSYTIVGTYDEYGTSYSFEDAILIGYLGKSSEENLFDKDSGLEAIIWFNNPRDTYTITKEILKDFGIDYEVAKSTNILYFNEGILEYKMIYPSGIIPPKRVIENAIVTYTPLFILSLLFAVMIYGAFNVWNNRDMKEIALLKSVGMTERQVRKMVRIKAMRLSVFPIVIGTVSAYISANLLLFIMWLNNAITYSKLSAIFSEKMQAPAFQLITPSVPAVTVLILLSFLTVYLSALLPARRSAKLKVIEGLNGISEKKIKFGKSQIGGKIEHTLARDYYKSYSSTYRTIVIALVISATVSTILLVSQSYRSIVKEYDKFHSPYNLSSQIYTETELDKALIRDIQEIKDVDELHIYMSKDFKLFFSDNDGFLSGEFQDAMEAGRKNNNELYVNIHGLLDEDYQSVLKENGLDDTTEYVLLNKTSYDNRTPYAFTKYIPITSSQRKEINIRYNAEGKIITLPIGGYIEYFPYELEGLGKKVIDIFTPIDNLEALIEEHGNNEDNPVNYYKIKLKEEENLSEVAQQCEQIILSYVPKSDYGITTDILRAAADKEQSRNEHLLNAGIQMILLIIALSNAYNSFNGNLRSRRREFQVLSTIGLTEKQMKRMIFSEGKILFGKILISFILAFCLVISVRAYHSNFDFVFAIKEIAFNLNYLPIALIFIVMVLGVLLAISSSINSILKEDSANAVREMV